MMKAIKIAMAATLLFWSTLALSDDGAATGKISRLDAVAGLAGAPNNADIRVSIAGATSFCSGGVTDSSWAFINTSDPNYKGVLATMMLAYSANKTITVNARAVPVGSGVFCQITWVNVYG